MLDSASADSTETCEPSEPSARSRLRSSTRESAPDDELRRVIDAWPDLPAPIRVGILAMVGAIG
ncbi:MAG: hypothetical protein KAS72_12735 [Phycisphaerales bacterium]|nr:hypothetical protein [Phycisphaerales bacterium]